MMKSDVDDRPVDWPSDNESSETGPYDSDSPSPYAHATSLSAGLPFSNSIGASTIRSEGESVAALAHTETLRETEDSAPSASSAPHMHSHVLRTRASCQPSSSVARNPFTGKNLQRHSSPSPKEGHLEPSAMDDIVPPLPDSLAALPDDDTHERLQSARVSNAFNFTLILLPIEKQQSYIRRVVRSTTFFQSTKRAERLSVVPPELSLHPELVPGDLFFNRFEDECRLWLWDVDSSQQFRWKPIGWGYERPSDHKVLILSEKKALPSWVQKSHFVKHTQNHPDLQDMLVVE